ncbi:MAG: flagellar biosynthetic protein FliR [Polyangiaceae bacterium]
MPGSLSPSLLSTVVELAGELGLDLSSWGLAWARLAPTLVLVPAFGLRAIPAPARAVLGLTMAATLAPALATARDPALPWALQAGYEALRGLPVAIGAASMLWAASQAGGLIDNLRGGREAANLPNVESGSTATGAMLSMLASIAFLESGGAARVLTALLRVDDDVQHAFSRVVITLLSSIEISIAVIAPVVAASIVLEVASALVSRAASPAYAQPLLAPLKSLALLGVFALVLERIVELLALSAAS